MTELQIFILVWIVSGIASWGIHQKLGWKSLVFHLLLGPTLFIK